jgi:hypothetical protein
MVAILVARDGMTEDEAEEYLAFNTWGAYVGPATPLYVSWHWPDRIAAMDHASVRDA